jgi:hypothetical protein
MIFKVVSISIIGTILQETDFNAVITENTDARVRRTQIDAYSRSHCACIVVVLDFCEGWVYTLEMLELKVYFVFKALELLESAGRCMQMCR